MSFHVERIRPNIYHAAFLGDFTPEKLQQSLTIARRYANQRGEKNIALIVNTRGAFTISQDFNGYHTVVRETDDIVMYVGVGIPKTLQWIGSAIAGYTGCPIHYTDTIDEAVKRANHELAVYTQPIDLSYLVP